MVDKSSILQIIGCLMKKPQLLSEVDKYSLTSNDFPDRFSKYIFASIYNLFYDGATKISPIDIENYLETNSTGKLIFKQNNGIEYLQDAEYLSDINTFPYYYKKLKKFNLLSSLNKINIGTKEFYNEDLTDPKALEINAKFEDYEISDIISTIKKNLLEVEKDYSQGDSTETSSAAEGIEEILDAAEEGGDIGPQLQGEIFNSAVAGARRGCFYLRSAASGVGKSRNMVGDACGLAFPFRYNHKTCEWESYGNYERVLFIATEQQKKEIQRMILAYLTGINETKFRYGQFSDREKVVISQAIYLMKQLADNFLIVQMPNPTIELVKTIVRENCITKDIGYVFYDYIFVGPSLLSEFQGFSLRNDEILLMFSTALKDLAVELNVFMMSATQLNAKGDDNSDIRNESAIAGSRSIINKADVGCIIARPTNEEIEILEKLKTSIGEVPNLVTDVYKVRSGSLTQARIWSIIDLGTLRKKDLFVTNSRFEIIPNDIPIIDWENTEEENKEILKLYDEMIKIGSENI